MIENIFKILALICMTALLIILTILIIQNAEYKNETKKRDYNNMDFYSLYNIVLDGKHIPVWKLIIAQEVKKEFVYLNREQFNIVCDYVLEVCEATDSGIREIVHLVHKGISFKRFTFDDIRDQTKTFNEWMFNHFDDKDV